jgi:hypothetical protein
VCRSARMTVTCTPSTRVVSAAWHDWLAVLPCFRRPWLTSVAGTLCCSEEPAALIGGGQTRSGGDTRRDPGLCCGRSTLREALDGADGLAGV